MFGLGGAEIVVILLAAVILFGPQKIPEIARTLGAVYKELQRLRRQADHALSEIRREVDLGMETSEAPKPRRNPRAVSSFGAKPLAVPHEDDYLSPATPEDELAPPTPQGGYTAGADADNYLEDQGL